MAAQQIFKLELLHSLGINDAATCESILSFVNGCSSFASEDLKRSLHIMVSVLQRRVDDSAALVKDHEDLQRSSETEIDKLRKERDTLKSDVTRLNNALAEFDSIKEKSASDIKELKTRNKALVDQVKTLTTEVKTKTSNFEELRKRIVAEFGVQISDQKNTYEKKLSEENASFLERFNTLRSEIEKRNDELSSMQISLESAQRDTASAKKECARLANVNKRLDGRVAALQALPSVGNKRLSADEARDQLEAKIAAISAQSDKAVQEALDEASDLREAVRKAEATKNLELVSANFTISEQKKIIDAQTAEIAEVKAHYNGIALRMKSTLGHFKDTDGTMMKCPVPTRIGTLVSLKYVYNQWKSMPCDNAGTFFATFICPITGRNTSLVSSEQLDIILPIAFDLGITTALPFKCQFSMEEVWVEFQYMEQICIASILCKLNFFKTRSQVECLLVCNNSFVLEVRVLEDGKIALEMNATRGGDAIPVRVMLPANFVFENLNFAHAVVLD